MFYVYLCMFIHTHMSYWVGLRKVMEASESDTCAVAGRLETPGARGAGQVQRQSAGEFPRALQTFTRLHVTHARYGGSPPLLRVH